MLSNKLVRLLSSLFILLVIASFAAAFNDAVPSLRLLSTYVKSQVVNGKRTFDVAKNTTLQMVCRGNGKMKWIFPDNYVVSVESLECN